MMNLPNHTRISSAMPSRREAFVAFFKQHGNELAPYVLSSVSDEVLELVFHKVRAALLYVAPEQRRASARWLRNRGYRPLQLSLSPRVALASGLDPASATLPDWTDGPSRRKLGDWRDVRRYLPGPEAGWKCLSHRGDGAGLLETPEGLIVTLSGLCRGGQKMLHASVAGVESAPRQKEAYATISLLRNCGPLLERVSPLSAGELAIQRHFFGPVQERTA